MLQDQCLREQTKKSKVVSDGASTTTQANKVTITPQRRQSNDQQRGESIPQLESHQPPFIRRETQMETQSNQVVECENSWGGLIQHHASPLISHAEGYFRRESRPLTQMNLVGGEYNQDQMSSQPGMIRSPQTDSGPHRQPSAFASRPSMSHRPLPSRAIAHVATAQSTPHAGATRVATITPADDVNPRANYPSPNTTGYQRSSDSNFGKRDAPSPWVDNQRKQQRTQQRAFASRKDNPFAFFQHDPNDAESFLEGLSQTNGQSNGGIIPEEELRKISVGIKRHGRFARLQSTRPSRPSERRRRQGVGSNKRVSNQDVLRMKATEASTYAMGSMSRQTPSHSAFATPPPYRGRSPVMNSDPSGYSQVGAIPYNMPASPEVPMYHNVQGHQTLLYYNGAPDQRFVDPMTNNGYHIQHQQYDDTMHDNEANQFVQQLSYPGERSAPIAGAGWSFGTTPYQPSQPGFVSQDLTQGEILQMDNTYDWSNEYYSTEQLYCGPPTRPMPDDGAFGPPDFC